MTIGRPCIRAHSAPWRRAIEFLITNREGTARVKEIVIEEVDQGVLQECSFSLDTDMAQQLMDDLWNCGLRPTEGTGSAGALKAVERHLEDMRTLVFEKSAKNQ